MAETTKKSKLQNQIEQEVKPKRKYRTRLNRYSNNGYMLDLRIHTPSSLGYMSLDSIDIAPAIVRLAKVKGLDVIAVTDYFTGAKIDAVKKAAKTSTVTVIPGTVIRCSIAGCNDVILTCLFPEKFSTNDVRGFLNHLGVPQSAEYNSGYLLTQPFEEILAEIDRAGAVAIPSTMDKTPYRKMAIPTLVEKYGFRVFDLAYYPDSISFFKETWPNLNFQLLCFSSASSLAQIGNRYSKVELPLPGFAGIKNMASRV